MNKKNIFIILLAAFLLIFNFDCMAEELSGGKDWKVEFNSNKEMESNFSTGNFDDVLDYMQPGDKASFKVSIKNTNTETTDWYMTNKIIKSLEDASVVAKGGGYTYKLTYTGTNGTLRVLFDSDEVGGENYIKNLEGLYEATDSLEDYFYLDTLKNGQSGYVDLLVVLDGETQGNDYQDTLAQLQMNFAVELTTVANNEEHREDIKENRIEYRKSDTNIVYIQDEDVIEKQPDTIKIVHTGDDTSLLPVVIIAIFLAVILVVLGILGIKLRKEIKNGTKALGIFLLAGYIFLSGINANAAGYFDSDFTYTIRVFSGGQGTFSTGRTCITIEAAPGATIDLTKVLEGMQLSGKYYAKGIRESGKDNNTVNVITGPVFTVHQDMDYVVAYAMNVGDTTYTVNYLDKATGKELLPSQSFVGNVGEKTVVAYRYVSGYLPEAYNLSKTLVENADENVLNFYYTKVEGNTGYYVNTDNGITYIDVEGDTVYEHIPGKVIKVDGEEQVVIVHDGRNQTVVNNNNNANNNAANNNDANNEANNNETENAAKNQDNTIVSEEFFVPADIIDLDDEEVPLSNGITEIPTVVEVLGKSTLADVLQENPGVRIAIIICGILLISIVGLIIYMIYRDKKKESNPEE